MNASHIYCNNPFTNRAFKFPNENTKKNTLDKEFNPQENLWKVMNPTTTGK